MALCHAPMTGLAAEVGALASGLRFVWTAIIGFGWLQPLLTGRGRVAQLLTSRPPASTETLQLLDALDRGARIELVDQRLHHADELLELGRALSTLMMTLSTNSIDNCFCFCSARSFC